MLNFLVALMLYSFWFAVGINFIVLFGLRLAKVIIHHYPLKKAFQVVLLPFSIGYLLDMTEKDPLDKYYKIAIGLMTFFILIGSVMIYYTRFE